MKYFIIMLLHKGTKLGESSIERMVVAPVLATSIRSYLWSYKSHHELLTIYAEADAERAEGLSPAEWLSENPPGSV